MSEQALTVSIEEHDAGFKDFEVEKRSGNKIKVRLHAPSLKVARSLSGREYGSFWPLIESCKPHAFSSEPVTVNGVFHSGMTAFDEGWFDIMLSQTGQEELISVAFILAFGANWEKKMILMRDLRQKEEQMAILENLKTSTVSEPVVLPTPS